MRQVSFVMSENYKGRLQELCAVMQLANPEYITVEHKTMPPSIRFECTLNVTNRESLGIGATKKEAQQLAAKHMLLQMHVTPHYEPTDLEVALRAYANGLGELRDEIIARLGEINVQSTKGQILKMARDVHEARDRRAYLWKAVKELEQ